MDWFTILKNVLPEVITIFKTTTAPAPVPTGPTSPTVPVPVPGPVTLERKPSDAVKALQHILNQALSPQPPLAEDGWLGPKTEKAIMDGIAKAQPYLSMLGK